MSHFGKVLIRRRVWLTSTGGLSLKATKADSVEPYLCSSFNIGPSLILTQIPAPTIPADPSLRELLRRSG